MSDTEPNSALRVTLPLDPSSVRTARDRTSDVLCASGWGHCVDDAKLIVSELVTNAIQQDASNVHLVLQLTGDVLHLEVSDWGGGHPVRRDPRPEEASGRGLNIVDCLADSWGAAVAEGRTTVWCDVQRHRLRALP